jgi:hypothetical protein
MWMGSVSTWLWLLGRGRDGNLLPNPPLLERIAEDPILRDVKIIAEAQVGARSSAILLARRTERTHERDSASTITWTRAGVEHSGVSAPQTERKPA